MIINRERGRAVYNRRRGISFLPHSDTIRDTSIKIRNMINAGERGLDWFGIEEA